MAFEVFDRKSHPASLVPTMAIQTRGTMSMNAAALQLLMETANAFKGKRSIIKEPDSHAKAKKDRTVALVEFLYDPDKRIIGIRLAPNDSQNAYPIRRQAGADSYLVTARSFLGHHKITTDKVRRFIARIYEGTIVGFPLNEGKESKH
jgi:hypothetical protein